MTVQDELLRIERGFWTGAPTITGKTWMISA
jgi:hypothetical protein